MLKNNIVSLIVKYSGVRRFKYHLSRLRDTIFNKYYKAARVDNKQIIFESYLGRSYACSPRAIYKHLLNNHDFDEYKFVWAFVNPEKYKYLESDRTRVVRYKSFSYFMAFARSKYWIVNGWISNRIYKKPGQRMIQCWHGTPLKRLRNDIVDNSKHATLSKQEVVKANNRDTSRYDYFISPSRFATEAFTSAFDLKELGKQDIVIETGYPRNDFLFNYTAEDVEHIKKQLGITDNKKIILYAPTWRDDQYDPKTGFVYDNKLNFDKFRTRFSDEYIILFRAHYNIANSFDFSKYKGFIYNVSDIDEVNNLYVISDILITDYSSVFFDYANLGRPIIFYMYDLEYYEKQLRGFYLNLNDLPGPIIRDENTLYSTIENISDVIKTYHDKYQTFHEKFNYLDDGTASERVVSKVIEL